MYRFHWLSSLKYKLRTPHSRNRRTCRKQNRSVQAPFAQTSVSKFVTESLEDRTLLTAFTVVNTNDSGTGSLREAIELANANVGADTITFDVSLAGQSIVLSNELVISDDLTITGLGSDQLIIDGNANNRIFNIDDSSTTTTIDVEIRGLTLTNGSAEQGGAIYSSESLSIVDSILSKNAATQGGAAIYNSDGILSVDNSRFQENKVVQGQGGAIYQYHGTLIITQSEFIENEASSSGGGIYSNSASSLSVSNSTFDSNKAIHGSGGGIYQIDGTLTVTQTEFIGNEASSFGGAIYTTFVSSFSVSYSAFDSNNSLSGGAIYHRSVLINTTDDEDSISNSRFTNNYSRWSGGAIYIQQSKMTVTASTFTENMTKSDGGAIKNDTGKLSIYDSSFIKNHTAPNSGSDGGAIDNSGTLFISSSTFFKNTANVSGGALSNSGADKVTIYNSTFSENKARFNGGAIDLFGNTDFSVINSTIVGNGTTTFTGGGIYSFQSTPNFTLRNSIVAGNRSGPSFSPAQIDGSYSGQNNIISSSISGLLHRVLNDNGGPTQTHALLAGSAAINAGNNLAATSIGLSTDQRGTGFPRIIDGTVDIGAFEGFIVPEPLHLLVDSNSDFDDGDYSLGQLSLREAIKLANSNLGADTISFNNSLTGQTIVLLDELQITDDLTITGLGASQLTINGNTNSRIFKIDDSRPATMIDVEIRGLTLTNGSAATGGAIYNLESLSVIDSTLSRNTATQQGAAIYNDRGILSVDNSRLQENKVGEGNLEGQGGGIYQIFGTLTVTQTEFIGNEASSSGGAINSSWASSFSVSNSTFDLNNARSGGAIRNSGTQLIVQNSFFSNSLDGGAIKNETGSLSIYDSSFIKNHTTLNGGAIDNNGTLFVSGSTFAENTTTFNGGALYNLGAEKVTIYNSTFSENTSHFSGGAIYLLGSSVFSVVNSTIVGNKATTFSGGGIYSLQAIPDFTLRNSIVAGNSSGNSAAQIDGSYSGQNNIISSSISGLLDPVLKDHGGSTKIHALLAGSAAINAGNNSAATDIGLALDQRGIGFPRIIDGTVDIGAFEGFIVPEPVHLLVDSNSDLDDGDYSLGQLSLREAIKLANSNTGSDTISFDNSFSGQTIVLLDELLITDDLTITGLGASQLTINGNANSRIFNIDDSRTGTKIDVEIRGLTLTNGSAATGGAIYNSESLSVIDSTLSRNTATQQGAAIYNDRGILSVDNSRLQENKVGEGNLEGHGGGIYQNFGTLTVTQTEFIGNEASSSGGAIYSNSASSLSVSYSTFDLNNSGSGGAIYNRSAPIIIQNSIFSNNASHNFGGGAINNESGNLSIYDSSFIKNHTTSNGGAIDNRGTLFISGSTFAENTTTFNGGALYNLGAEKLTIYNSTFSENMSNFSGGAIFLIGITDFSVVNSTVVGNKANTFSGGGIYSLQAIPNFTLRNSIVAGNTSGSSAAQVDGSYSGQNNIISSSITGLLDPVLKDHGGPTKTHALLAGSAAINAGNNSAATNAGLTTDQRGTGFARLLDGTVDIGAFEANPLHFLVDTNSDLDDGDYSDGQLSLREAIKLANSNAGADVISFDATLTGQTIVLESEMSISDNLTIIGLGADQLTIDGNKNSRIFDIDNGNSNTSILVELSGLNLTNGYSDQGGAVRNSETLSIIDSTITKNEGRIHGGGIYTNEGELSVTNSTITENRSSYGGGIYNSDGLLTVEGSTFSDNLVGNPNQIGLGGGIYSSSGSLTVTNSLFSGNTATTYGGGIFNSISDTHLVSNSTFVQNSAKYGGGIYNINGSMAVVDGTFTENEATTDDGGGIYHSINPNHTEIYEAIIMHSQFSKNSAKFFGGGINILNGIVSISESTFTENSSMFSGGGVFNSLATLAVEDSTFSKNTATANGGGIGNGGTLSILRSTLTENTSGSSGGAVYNSSTGTTTTINTTLSGNSSSILGGGLYSISTLPLTIINTTIVLNSATSKGGGIYSHLVTPTITNSIVAGNTAGLDSQIFGNFANNTSIIQHNIEGLLDPVLSNNGGLTQTHALLIGSLAINAGDNSAAILAGLNNDQRGTGFDRIIDGTIDIGAYEVQTPFTQIDLRVVKSKTSTQSNGESSALPENLGWLDEWSGYWLEIWINKPSTGDLGILSANLNLTYNTEITTATSIEYGAAFTLNQTGTINDLTGTIEDLTAETSLTDAGDDQHVLFARIRFESTNDDSIDLDLQVQSLNPQSPDFSIGQPEVIFVGGAPSEEIHGPSPETKIYANPYDLNDDDAINFRDLMLFASAYNTIPSESNSNYSWFADLNQSDRVNFKDLILFASNYGKRKSNQSTIVYSQNFPEAWNNLLIADTSQAEPQTSPVSLSQSAADSVLDGVVEYVSPQLTPSQNETLENIDIEIVDLTGNTLGRAVTGTIYIDVNAAGYGWFIDDTPGDHSEFEQSSHLSLIALPDSDAAGRVDLWSVIMHELGHLLGYEHENEGVMEETLAPGIRKLPHFADEHVLQSDSETDEFFTSLKESSSLIAF
ncbi:choice-of-anchor Q domain-containing protein [Gimesia aquarii]|nr:choice-of-anchor Q domain-containing protein [Gimesia aquarii]